MSIYGEAEPGGESLAATLSEGSAKKGGGSLLGGFASWEAFKASRASQAAALLVGVGLIAAASSAGGSCSATGAPAVATGDLDAYFSFDDMTAGDASGNCHDGRWEGQETYADGKPGKGKAAAFDGSSRILIDAFKNMQFGSQFSVSVFFERSGGQGNYQGIVNNGYCKMATPSRFGALFPCRYP